MGARAERRSVQDGRVADEQVSLDTGRPGPTPAVTGPGQGGPALGGSVLEQLAAVVRARPEALAVTSGGEAMTYGQLAGAVLTLADQLRARLATLPGDLSDGAGPPDGAGPTNGAGPDGAAGDPAAPIAILAAQGIGTAVGTFAAMAAGRAAVILDPMLPLDRLCLLATLSGARLLLTDDDAQVRGDGRGGDGGDGRVAAADLVAGTGGALDVLPLRPRDLPAGAGDAHAAADALAAVAVPGGDLAPASIIFTSGSTGTPKGVVLTHRTVLAGAHISRERLHLSAADRVALVLPHAFAAGQEVAFMALLTGASLHALDPRVSGLRDVPAWLRSEGVTTLHGTPSLVRAIMTALRPEEVLAAVRLVTTCGEATSGRDVLAARRHLRPDATFTSWLGSSETGQLTYLELPGDAAVPDGPLAAGTAAPLKEVAVLGADGEPLPAGEVGAVTITSAHLSGGYWRDPERTAERFTLMSDGRTRYATGDRGWLDEGGVLHLAGRADDAVKIRGYLVEPADVEAVLGALDGVAQVVVRGRRAGAASAADGAGSTGPEAPLQLVAWVVPDARVGAPSLAAMRRAAQAALPEWMVPTALVLLAALPLTERGKLDVARLPDPAPRPDPRPARTPAQARVGAIWADVLRLDAVDPDETFPELGGDSLAVEEMLERLREATGRSLALKDLAEHPTLAEFAALVDGPARGRRGTGARSGLAATTVRFRGQGIGLPVFCFAGNASHAAVFAELAAALGPEHAVHGFQVNGLTNRGLLDWTVAANAARHLRDLQALAPTGPVVLVGHSLGGLIALEAARQLAARGREVALLVIIDTFLPPRHGGHVGDWDTLAPGRGAVPAHGDEAQGARGTGGADGARAADAVPAAATVPTAPTADDPSRSPWRLVLRTLRRQEGRVLRHRLMLLGAGPLRYRPATAEAVMWQHGIWLARTARIRPWAGRTLLFTSEENRDPLEVWDTLLVGEHEVVHVPGDHSGLLRPPYLQDVLGPVTSAVAEVTGPTPGLSPLGAAPSAGPAAPRPR